MNKEYERWKEIANHSQAYYEGHPDISDEEFDVMYSSFMRDFPESEHLKDVAKGFDPDNTSLQKFKHKYSIVGSLSKIHSTQEVEFNDLFYDISVKLDGSSLVLYYVEGQLERALTRGDGVYGLDVTDKIKYLCPVALEKKLLEGTPFTGAIRGEVVMSNDAFAKYKETHSDAKMARNVATGLMMRKEASEDLRFCTYVTYKILAIENVRSTPYLVSFMRKQLSDWGFEVVHSVVLSSNMITDENMRGIRENEHFKSYPTDGLVIERESTSIEEGVTIFKELAYKFPEEIKEARVVNVEWELSPKAKLVPVVVIEPTELTGATVTRVSGFNYKFINDNKIDTGAVITIMRSGAVIPDIQSVIKPAPIMHIPCICPYCGQPLSMTQTEVDLECTNEFCVGKEFWNTYTFVEIFANDIKGVGDALIRELITKTNARTECDLIKQLNTIENTTIEQMFTPANAEKIKQLKQLLNKPWDKEVFLKSLNIKFVGDVAAKEIATNKKLFDILITGSQAEVKSACESSLNTSIANSLINNLERIQSLAQLVCSWQNNEVKEITKYVAITGSLSVSRKEFEKELNSFGYGLTDNLNKAECLITNDPNSGSSKNTKAKKLGIQILTEAQFRQTLV